jgi:transcriptional regulator with XRE-family HTH domain
MLIAAARMPLASEKNIHKNRVMSTIMSDPTTRIAVRIKAEREARGWSLAEVAMRSGVSRAMISKIERAESSPTAALLGRLCGAFGLTMSTLLARAEGAAGRLVRAAAQQTWQDPGTKYLRRSLSPRPGGPLDLVLVELPPGTAVSYPAETYTFIRQQIWVQSGHLRFEEGDEVHELAPGDCLELGAAAPCTFANRGTGPCRYLVAVALR